MLRTLFCQLNDSGIGKFNRESVPQQTRMEMLIEGMPDRSPFLDVGGSFLDAEDWPGVMCNDFDEIVSVSWFCVFTVEGCLDLKWIPPTVRYFEVASCAVIGTADLTALPRFIEELYFDKTRLNGSINLTELPDALRCLRFTSNRLTGAIDLTCLPGSLEVLVLRINALSGSVDFTALPNAMKVLILTQNQFCGTVTLFDIRSNDFCGPVELCDLPEGLNEMNLAYNAFRGTAFVQRIPEGFIRIDLSGNDIQEVRNATGEIYKGPLTNVADAFKPTV